MFDRFAFFFSYRIGNEENGGELQTVRGRTIDLPCSSTADVLEIF